MKIALITGANRGLGFETAKQLLAKGYYLYLGIREIDKSSELLKKLGIDESRACPVKLDVTKNSDIKSVQDIIKKNGKGLDLIISNAGVFLEPQDEKSETLKVDPIIILKTIEVNTMGPLKIFQAFVPIMVQSGGGQIINISSGMGQLNGMGARYPGYRMSKTSLNALTCMLAVELAPKNIVVNSVCPGWVRTDMGGESASLSVEEGVETTIWLAGLSDPPTGKFFRNKQEIPW